MSKYKEIAKQLRERIDTGFYKTGELIPDQNALAEEFNTSRATLRKAIQLLIVEGLLYSRRGAGTYVRKNLKTLHKDQSKADDFFGSTKSAGEDSVVTSKILRFEVRFPNEKEADDLFIEITDPIYDIARVRYVDGIVKCVEYSLMPVNLVSGLTEDILHKSVFNYIQNDLNLTIGGAHRVITADKANQIDIEELGIEENSPVLQVRQVAYLDNGAPFESSKSRFSYKTGKIVVDVLAGDYPV